MLGVPPLESSMQSHRLVTALVTEMGDMIFVRAAWGMHGVCTGFTASFRVSNVSGFLVHMSRSSPHCPSASSFSIVFPCHMFSLIGFLPAAFHVFPISIHSNFPPPTSPQPKPSTSTPRVGTPKTRPHTARCHPEAPTRHGAAFPVGQGPPIHGRRLFFTGTRGARRCAVRRP